MEDARQEWRTPNDFWQVIDAEFNFQLDAAASPENARCAKYYTAEQDSLSDACPWSESTFINPGYHNMLPWILKAEQESRPKSLIAILGLIAPSSAWWKQMLLHADEVRLIGGKRIQFDPAEGVKRSSNARENCLIIYRNPCILRGIQPKIWTWNWRECDLRITT